MGENKSGIELNGVGDGAVGKACLLTTFAENCHPQNHDPKGRKLIYP